MSSMQKAGIGTRGTGTCATGTAILGHALLGHALLEQQVWDKGYWDSATGTCDSVTFFVIVFPWFVSVTMRKIVVRVGSDVMQHAVTT